MTGAPQGSGGRTPWHRSAPPLPQLTEDVERLAKMGMRA